MTFSILRINPEASTLVIFWEAENVVRNHPIPERILNDPDMPEQQMMDIILEEEYPGVQYEFNS